MTGFTDDHFGSALAAGDFNGDSRADLAVGAPLEDLGAVIDAGAASAVYGSASGLTTSGGQVFSQSGSLGSAEAFDLFGFALAADS